MNTLKRSLLAVLLLAFPLAASANCALQQTVCETTCKATNLNDTTGKNTCLAKCAAERAACSTKEGASQAAEKASELGAAALDKAKSLFDE